MGILAGSACTQKNEPGSSGQSGTKTATIFDPEFNVEYVSTTIPAGWLFQGGVFRGDPCEGVSSPFYRVSSPDGLAGLKVFPRVDLGWSNNRAYIPRAEQGCQPLEGEITASGYLQYLIARLHVNFVKDVTEPAQVERARKYAQSLFGRMPSYSGDAAVARTTFNINGIAEDEQIAVSLICHTENLIWPKGTNKKVCTAEPKLVWAPQGKLEATMELLAPAMKVKNNPEWVQKWSRHVAQQNEAIRARNASYWAAQRAQQAEFYSNLQQQTVANGEAFRARMDNQYRVHEQQVATMQRGGDMAMARAMANVDAQSRMAGDACDFALGVQRRVNPETGQAYKTDSGYTYDWVDPEGHHVLTNYVNDNPNGINGKRDYVLTQNESN
jgi:hypothetical protein